MKYVLKSLFTRSGLCFARQNVWPQLSAHKHVGYSFFDFFGLIGPEFGLESIGFRYLVVDNVDEKLTNLDNTILHTVPGWNWSHIVALIFLIFMETFIFKQIELFLWKIILNAKIHITLPYFFPELSQHFFTCLNIFFWLMIDCWLQLSSLIVFSDGYFSMKSYS